MTRRQEVLNNMMKKMEWLIKNKNYNVAIMYLQGSQNYGMDENNDDYQSDIDVYCFVVPTLKQLIEDVPPVSKEIEMEDKSHIVVKDIRLLDNLLEKSNPVSLELIFTPCFIINKEYNRVSTAILNKNIKNMRDDIANCNVIRLINSLRGIMHNKYSHMLTETDDTLLTIAMKGYNPKDFHHMMRISYMIREIIKEGGNVDFESLMTLSFLSKEQKIKLKEYKTNPIEKEKAIKIADKEMQRIDKIVDSFIDKHKDKMTINQEVIDRVHSYIDEYVELCIKKEVISSIRKTNQAKKEIIRQLEGKEANQASF